MRCVNIDTIFSRKIVTSLSLDKKTKQQKTKTKTKQYQKHSISNVVYILCRCTNE